MDDSVEWPSATKKQKVKDRGKPEKWSGAAIIVYIVCIGAWRPPSHSLFWYVSRGCMS